jgi:hypothetical protein
MLPEAVVAKLERAARLVGSAAELVADGLRLLRKATAREDPAPRERRPRLRPLPEPTSPVCATDRARAEQVLKQRGILGEDLR